MSTSFKMSLEEVKTALVAGGCTIIGENRNGNNLATVLNLSNGCIVNCWDSGKVNLQGKCTSEVETVLSKPVTKQISNKKYLLCMDMIQMHELSLRLCSAVGIWNH